MTGRALGLLVVLAVLAGAAPAAGDAARASAASASVDPGRPGPEAVDELHYDLGATAFQPDGFPGRVELEGQVYAPRRLVGRAPVVVVLHGRHVTCATDDDTDLRWPCPTSLPPVPSYLGYGTLGRNLASHGFVVVSIGANGINAADGLLEDGGAAARAELVLAHLRILQGWDRGQGGGPFARFAGHLDLGRVGLVGHSRGGEGVVAAAALNQRIGSPFGVRAVVALAPVDFGRRLLGGVPLAVVLPACDGDVSDLQGVSYFDDARYASPGDPAPKATALLYGANHNFFNSVWTSGPGSGDDTEYAALDQGSGSPEPADPCAPGSRHRLTAAVQDQAGAALLAGFLRRHLRDEPGLRAFATGTAPFPASVGPARWSIAHLDPVRLDVARWDRPDQLRVNRAGQVSAIGPTPSGLVCTGAEVDDGVVAPSPVTECPGTPAGWATHRTGALDVSWVRPGAVVREPLALRGTDVTRFDGLRFRVAVPDDARNARARQDLTVVLEDVDGRRAGVAVAGLTNALLPPPAGFARHSVMNGVRVPLSRFRGVDLQRIRAVELRLDRTPAGRLWLADLAFTAEGTGGAVGPTEGAPSAPGAVERCRTAAERWACRLARVAWGRDPSDDELGPLAAAAGSAAGRRAVARSVVAGPEARQLRLLSFVQRYAQTGLASGDLGPYLPTEPAQRSWESDIRLLADELLGTVPRLGSAGEGVVAAYQTVAGRTPSAAEARPWVARAEERGVGVLVASLQRSVGVRQRTVEARYREVLGRPPTASERATWTARLAGAGGEQELVAALLGSPA